MGLSSVFLYIQMCNDTHISLFFIFTPLYLLLCCGKVLSQALVRVGRPEMLSGVSLVILKEESNWEKL